MVTGVTKTVNGNVVETADGSLTMEHGQHGEWFHSKGGALQEAQQLYIEGSAFSERSQPTSVLDVGLGLGYNALSTISAWSQASQSFPLKIVSLEIEESLVRDLLSGTAPWQKNWPESWIQVCQSVQQKETGHFEVSVQEADGRQLHWQIFVGDALERSLPAKEFDFIWQDAFSPSKNPNLWSEMWFEKLHHCAAPGCVLVSYSVAGKVRRALASSRWSIEKIPGKGSKRQWLKAWVDCED